MALRSATLSNGLVILGEVDSAAHTAAAGFFVRTGARDEPTPLMGVSHFLEHMMFKGSEGRSAFDVNREFDEMGASYNAFTSEENTVYFAAVLPEFQDRMLDLLGDMLRPALRQDDFDTEKNVILDEIARYQDQPAYLVSEKLMGAHFAGHPLGNSVLGSSQSIRNLLREDMQAYFDRRYSPGNVTVVATGNLDHAALLRRVRRRCGAWRPHEVGRTVASAAGAGTTTVLPDCKLTREHIGLMSPAPSGQDKDRFAAQLLATIVGDATGSRYFYALIEPAVADEAHMSYDALDGAGVFQTGLSTDPGRAAEAIGIVRAELARFMEEGPAEEELQAAKNKIASGATRNGELPMGRLVAVGFDWLYRKDYVPLARQIDELFAVSRDRVREVAQRCDLSAATILAMGPAENL